MELLELIKNHTFCKGTVANSGNRKIISPRDTNFDSNFGNGDEVIIIKIPKKRGGK